VLPIGAIEAVPVNVRVIAATHRDLAALVRDGAFRQDLYYRLNILRIEMPPLRDRAGDLPVLAELLYRRAQERLGMSDGEPLPAIVRARLARYVWPGNIRELENVTERIAVLVAGANLTPVALQRELQAAVPELFSGDHGTAIEMSDGAPAQSLAGVAKASQAEHIRRVLADCGGNRAAACAQLGISPTTLWRRLREE
jgi:propionate catabolism operon transcriptional regulator